MKWNTMRAAILASLFALTTPCSADPALNADVNQHNIGATICVAGYTKTVRPPARFTNKIKKQLMREAGVPLADIHDYELDHIVPLALGGCPDCQSNLQLQPWNGPNGAHKKDRLEVKLQCLVCTGEVCVSQMPRRTSMPIGRSPTPNMALRMSKLERSLQMRLSLIC